MNWTTLGLPTLSGILSTVVGGLLLSLIQARLSPSSNRSSGQAAAVHAGANPHPSLSSLRAQAVRLAPLGLGMPYMVWAARFWSLSQLELLLAGVATAAVCVSAIALGDYFCARLPSAGAFRSLARIVCVVPVLAAITAGDRMLRDRLTLILPGSVERQEVITGEVFGEPNAAVFVLVRPSDATGDTKYLASRPDTGGQWAVTVDFDGASGTRFVVRAVALDPYALDILGDPSPIAADRIDGIATIRSRLAVVTKR